MSHAGRASIVFTIACLSLCVMARAAHAQAADRGTSYVGGTLIGDIKRFSGDISDPLFDGQTIGGGVVVGTALHRRLDLQFGVDVPRFTATSRDRLVTFQRNTITLQSITANQTLSFTTLVRVRGASRGRVQLGYLGGLSIVRFRRDNHTEAPENTPSALIPKPDGTVDYAAGPTVGIDARIELSSHLSLVPGLYASVFSLADTNGVVIRPRVSMRWMF